MARDDDRIREVVYQISVLEKERADLSARIGELSDELEGLTRTPDHQRTQDTIRAYLKASRAGASGSGS